MKLITLNVREEFKNSKDKTKLTYSGKNFNRGFTLIELLIVLTIIGILFGIGFANYRRFSETKNLQRVKKQVIADLRVTQENALSGNKPIGVTDPGCSKLNAHKFSISSSISYSLAYVCLEGDTTYKTVSDLFSSDTYVISSSPSSVSFKVLGNGTDLGSNMTIVIKQIETGKEENIVVSPTGEIK